MAFLSPTFLFSLTLFVFLIPVQAWLSPSSQTKNYQRPLTLLLGSSSSSSSSTSSSVSQSSTLSLYNTLTRQKQVLEPLQPNHFSIYTCGPTVYDSAHVGNFRAFLTYDLLKRVLQYLGFTVTHVCNLTDVDDKIIQRANEQKLEDVTTLTRKYEELFLQDLDALNIVRADVYPRATEHIDEMMDMIRQLRDKGLAYETSDGSWYFDTQQQADYGTKLVQLNFEEMEQTEVNDEKRHFADFCLWKAFKEGVDRMDAAWESEDIKLGRPGWHLECSAMSRKYLGDSIDLHGGGIDLRFPHHENEIAQSEGASGKTFCNCWFHNGFVNIGEEKMSKSLGNFLTLSTACPTPADVRAYRYLVISSQYRNPLAFTEQAMKAAKNAIARMDKIRTQIQEAISDPKDKSESEMIAVADEAIQSFETAIRDDLSMPRASAALFTLVKAAEQELKRVAKDGGSPDTVGLRAVLNAMDQMDRVFGIFYQVPQDESQEGKDDSSSTEVPTEVMELVSKRTAAKNAKDWELADSLRARITELGYAVKDVKGGDPIVSKVES